MYGFLQLWCALGAATVILDLVIIHRRGRSLKEICAFAAIEALQAGNPDWFAALLGRRRFVIPMMVGLWPVVLALLIGGKR